MAKVGLPLVDIEVTGSHSGDRVSIDHNLSYFITFSDLTILEAPVEELQEKDAIPLGEREESLELPAENQSKVLTTPAVRKMASDNKVYSFTNFYFMFVI